MKRSKAIVVTGAAGFIGSCVIRELNNRGFDHLILADRLGCNKKWANLVGKQFVNLLHKDQALEWIRHHADQIQAIIHLGACSSTVEDDADYLLRNNTHYSQELATLAVENGWRFIYASSAATYGDGTAGFDDKEQELEKLQPLNMYGYSKHLFDLWLKRKGWLNKVVGLKYFNVFGPNEWHKGRMASHVLKMLSQLQEGKIRLFKTTHTKYVDGGQMRDFVYVKDVARMTCDLLQVQVCGLFNIGMGRAHTWNDLAYALMRAVNKQVPVEYIDMPADLVGQYQNYTCANMQKWIDHGLESTRWDLNSAVNDYVSNHLLNSCSW